MIKSYVCKEGGSLFFLIILGVVVSFLFFFANRVYAYSYEGKIRVVTTINVLADWVEKVGGNRVKVKSIITDPRTDIMRYDPKNDIALLQKAQIFVNVGRYLEVWAPKLLKMCNNRHLRVIILTKGIPLVNRNPYMWFDPAAISNSLNEIRRALTKVSSENAPMFQRNMEHYQMSIDGLFDAGRRSLSGVPSEERKVVSISPEFSYLFIALGIKEEVVLLNYQGGYVSNKKVDAFISKIKEENIKYIVVSERTMIPVTEMIKEATGVREIRLSPFLNLVPGTHDYVHLLRYNIDNVLSAFKRR